MEQVGSSRWVGLLLLIGVVAFSIATIIAEPFEQATPEGLYTAIASNLSLYRTVNILSTIGMALLLIGFFLLALRVRSASGSLFVTFIGLFSAALIFWIAEIIARLTSTSASAQAAGAGLATRSGIGIGFDPLFLGFFAAALAGAALLVWGLGKAGVLSFRTAAISSLIVLASGIVAAIFYPWVGGVERVMFYPLFLVILPLAIFFLIRRRQPAVVMGGS